MHRCVYVRVAKENKRPDKNKQAKTYFPMRLDRFERIWRNLTH